MQGAPTSVSGGSFYCYNNKLESLEGAPTSVSGGNFYCSKNKLISLQGVPTSVSGRFVLDYSPDLPLLRTNVAEEGVDFSNKESFPGVAEKTA